MRASLAEFGADPSALLLLDDDGPELLPYATLLTARRTGDAVLGVVDAVYEWQGAPLLFLIDADSLNDDRQLQPIRRLLAMRGDAPYLGVVAPGSLRVYRIGLDRKSLGRARVSCDDEDRAAVFTRLGNERPQAAITSRGWISNVVLNLLSRATTKLIGLGVSREDAISLVGRALFTRFLADRNLLPENLSDPTTAAGLFDTRQAAADTSRWLDATFNGDLPLSEGLFETLPAQTYRILGDVLRRAPDGELFLGWEEKWANLDFAHIPVGVLSQAYELYLRQHAPAKQKREGGYFTPAPIADLMVRAAFGALRRRNAGESARVLDPAVGGGIFLLTAFRELVAARWRADGRRPDADALRRILYEKLVGFDVNEDALRFAALGLYLLSIELDPDPTPVDKLRFRALRGSVLHRVSGAGEKEGASLGSLGQFVGDEHRGRYDLVVGNPPWASGTKLPEWSRVRDTVARIAAAREITNASPPLPNEVLDLPFVWRAMEWAKPDGQIAFALHARLLFQQGDGMPAARRALFEALDVTSIVNGAELRHTKVWPQISAPFCLLFATNRTPGVEAGFRFISPRLDARLNGAGRMRIDVATAEVVSSQQLADTPDILKTLFRGSKADLGILERIRAEGHPTLYDFWKEKIGIADRGRLRGSGNGYQALRTSSGIRRQGDGRPGLDATHLHGRPELVAGAFSRILVDVSSLPLLSHERMHRPRDADLYIGPQAIVHKSPPAAASRIGVVICDEGVVFSETFYGYSPQAHADATLLVRYLALVLGSRVAIWFALMTSGEFGFERDVIEKAALDRMPVPDFDNLGTSRHREIESLFEELRSGRVGWEKVDEWVGNRYGLGERDLQVIGDTLEFNLPFAENKRNAQAMPGSTERERFCEVLKDELTPWCRRFGASLAVGLSPVPAGSPWLAIAVRTGRRPLTGSVPSADWPGLLRAADDAAASEIVFDSGADALLICRLAQRRYWSETQARLLAQRIAWSHIELLKGHATA
ncbi:MAG: N-6 DNA methylase [Acidobacteria bacterium]|nr:N-6 DNA methylase [Acidobacteriota bacterium]